MGGIGLITLSRVNCPTFVILALFLQSLAIKQVLPWSNGIKEEVNKSGRYSPKRRRPCTAVAATLSACAGLG